MKIKFGLFSRGQKCEMCKQTFCARCHTKVQNCHNCHMFLAVMGNRLDLLFADANPGGAFQCHSRFCLEPHGPDGISVEKNRARPSSLLERLEPEFGRFELEFELKGEENVAARRF